MTNDRSSLLVVDDDPDVLTAIKLLLQRQVDAIHCTDDPSQIPDLIAQHKPDALLLDMNFGPGESSGAQGLEWLRRIIQIDPAIVTVMITAHAGVGTAVEAMKHGAADFVVKPWQNEKLVATVNAALKIAQSQKETSRLRTKTKTVVKHLAPTSQPILGTSNALAQVLSMVDRAAPTDANILVLGENGTGKELIARELHQRSNRADEAFISVDLGAIAETVFESELFGHQRGAFTDARSDRIGRLASASGGTLFLDEVGNLPLHLQAKLLTVLEQRQVTPVGSNLALDIDVRLIAATNLSRDQLADEQRFRQDLLYRINTVEIQVPPLRERLEDIPILLTHYLQFYERKYGKPSKQIPDSLITSLAQFSWPGNVRALRHAVERAVVLSAGDHYRLVDFSLPTNEPQTEPDSTPPTQGVTLDKLEKIAICQALEQHEYNISKSAKALGLTRAALYRRMKKHDL